MVEPLGQRSQGRGGEHQLARGVGRVEVDDGLDHPVAVAGRVRERLPDPPQPGRRTLRGACRLTRLLRTHPEVRRPARVGVGGDGLVLGVVVLERGVPARAGHHDLARRVEAVGGSALEPHQRVEVVARTRGHPGEHRVAHHHRQHALLRRQRPRRRRRLVPGGPAGSSTSSGWLSASHSSISEESVWRMVSPSHSTSDSSSGRAVRVGHRLPQRAVGVAEVAQHQPLGPGELVAAHEVGEPHRLLPHLAQHRLRAERVLAAATGASGGTSRTSPRAAPRAAAAR